MNLYKTAPYDPAILEVASLTELPNQPINLGPKGTFLGNQVQQLRASAEPPVVNSAAPIVITRRSLPSGGLQYRVQFIAPTSAQDPNYQTTSILLANPSGTTTLAATAGKGPIIFNSPGKTSAPGSIVVQQNNSNASSETGLGTGSSRALVQL
jgi:hypothetical protein